MATSDSIEDTSKHREEALRLYAENQDKALSELLESLHPVELSLIHISEPTRPY